MDLAVPLQVIGIVRTAHTELATTPIQAGLNRAGHGTIEMGDRYREGLDGLAEFDYAWLHNLAEPGKDPPLRPVPFLLKPDVTRFDRPPGDPRCGWYDHVPISDGITPTQLTPPRPPT
jgi:hypothetical protein